MADAANWGQVLSLIDNSEPRKDPEEGSAYVAPLGSGLALPRGFKMRMPEDTEPYVVWLMVVGSIAGLFIISRLFKTAKA